jgi:hypothetical protein
MRYYLLCCFLLAVHHSHILTFKIIQSVSQSNPLTSVYCRICLKASIEPFKGASNTGTASATDASTSKTSVQRAGSIFEAMVYLCGKQDGEESISQWWWKEVKRRALLSALQASDRNESGRMRACRPRWREGRRSTGKEREEKEARRDCEAQIRLRCCGNAGTPSAATLSPWLHLFTIHIHDALMTSCITFACITIHRC